MKREADGGTAYPALMEHQGFKFQAPGMSLFDYASVACLQGLLAHSGEGYSDAEEAAATACNYAAALVRRLNDVADSK